MTEILVVHQSSKGAPPTWTHIGKRTGPQGLWLPFSFYLYSIQGNGKVKDMGYRVPIFLVEFYIFIVVIQAT